MITTILLIEDDSVLCETLRYNLERDGYRVMTASDGQVGLELARTQKPDLIVLDVMLPSLDGFSICRIIRRESALPILMLTARQDEVDRIAGLEMGADDYVIKPFSLGEFLARVRALLRRTERQAGPIQRETLEIGDLAIDIAGRRVFRATQEIALSP